MPTKKKSTRKKPNLFKWLKQQSQVRTKNGQIKKVEARVAVLKREKRAIVKKLTAKYKRMK